MLRFSSTTTAVSLQPTHGAGRAIYAASSGNFRNTALPSPGHPEQLFKLGGRVGASTIRRILRRHRITGANPSP
jgi:hypothetical protein